MNFRFRKSFRLLPGLKGTISKKGVSLNFNAGILSRTWGTRGTTTTVDMPGTSGMFWRGEKRRRKLSPEEVAENKRKMWAGLCWLLIIVQFLLGLIYLYIIPELTEGCDANGGFVRHAIYIVVLGISYAFAGKAFPKLRGPLGLLLMVVLFWVQWKFYHAAFMPACA